MEPISISGVVTLLFVLAVLAFAFFLYDQKVPGDSTIKLVIRFIIVMVAVVGLLSLIGFGPGLTR
jgi:hypothetical protein